MAMATAWVRLRAEEIRRRELNRFRSRITRPLAWDVAEAVTMDVVERLLSGFNDDACRSRVTGDAVHLLFGGDQR